MRAGCSEGRVTGDAGDGGSDGGMAASAACGGRVRGRVAARACVEWRWGGGIAGGGAWCVRVVAWGGAGVEVSDGDGNVRVGVDVDEKGRWERCDGGDDVDGIGAPFGEDPRPRFLLGWPGILYWDSRHCSIRDRARVGPSVLQQAKQVFFLEHGQGLCRNPAAKYV